MKVRMITTYAGPGGICGSGKTITLSDEEAKALIEGGYAVAVDGAGSEPDEAPEESPPQDGGDDSWPKPGKGGWFELSDGSKAQGRDAAEACQRLLDRKREEDQ